MPYPSKLLNAGEEIVLDLRPHWWAVTPQTAALVLSLALGIALLSKDLWEIVDIVVALGILVALGWAGAAYAGWLSTNFTLTSDRLIYRSGVLRKSGIEIPVGRVNTVMFSQGVFERMLGAGDLIIESASEDGQQRFSNVRKPELVQNAIHRQMEATEQRGADRIAGAVRGGGGGGLSVAEQLEKLDELHGRGVLSDAEFEQQKRALLG